MEALRDHIAKLAEQNLEDPKHFLVDVLLRGSGAAQKVQVLVDGDDGISIDTCAKLSRRISEDIEGLIDGKFTLEVSSPGVDYPLSTIRQYTKNIGRRLKVTNLEDFNLKGRLQEVSEDGILLLQEKKKGNKKETTEHQIPFTDIKKTTVLIEF